MSVILSKAQQSAVDGFRFFLEGQLDKDPKRGDCISRFEVVKSDYGSLWLIAETDMAGLGENNLLRFVSRQHWHIAIGKRGALEVWSSPKSFHQFRDGRAFGMNFKRI